MHSGSFNISYICFSYILKLVLLCIKSFMIKVLHILLFEIFVLIIVEPIKIFQIDYNGK